MTILKQIRKKNRYTQEEFAKILGIKKRAYASYENGERKTPPLVLAKILRIRGTSDDIKLANILEEFYGQVRN